MSSTQTFRISVNFKPDHPPRQTPGEFFWKGEFSTPWHGHKESAKARPLGQKNCAKTPPPGQLFSKIQKKTKHGTEIMKNSTEMLICLETLKQ